LHTPLPAKTKIRLIEQFNDRIKQEHRNGRDVRAAIDAARDGLIAANPGATKRMFIEGLARTAHEALCKRS